MRTMKIVTIVCWVLAALVLTGLIIWFMTGSLFGMWSERWGDNMRFGINLGGIENLTGPYEKRGSQDIKAEDLDKINIEWVSGDVTIIPYDGDVVIITEYAQRELNDNEKMYVISNNRTLTIKFTERSIVRRMPSKRLEVHVPQNLMENMNMLDVSTVSGGVVIENAKPEMLKINTVSGVIGITNIESPFIDAATTSGAINIVTVNANKLEATTVSGAVTISDAIADALHIGTTSGRITATGEFNRVNITTVSGSTTVTNTVVPSNMSISSVSGSIDVYLPDPGELSVSHSSVSGRFTSEIPVKIQNGAPINFSTVSGRMTMHSLGD